MNRHMRIRSGSVRRRHCKLGVGKASAYAPHIAGRLLQQPQQQRPDGVGAVSRYPVASRSPPRCRSSSCVCAIASTVVPAGRRRCAVWRQHPRSVFATVGDGVGANLPVVRAPPVWAISRTARVSSSSCRRCDPGHIEKLFAVQVQNVEQQQPQPVRFGGRTARGQNGGNWYGR